MALALTWFVMPSDRHGVANWVCDAVRQTWLGYWCAWLLDSVGLWCCQTDMVRLTGFVMPSERKR